mgnify:FL=1
MATYDMTLASTVGVGSNVNTTLLPAVTNRNIMYVVEGVLDIARLVRDGYSFATGDVFQLLNIPAKSLVLVAGAYVETAFDGTSPVVDIDFAAGDDFVDGASVATVGFLAGGANGQGLVVGGTPTFTQLISTADTIDVLLAAGANDITTGVLRVFAVVVDLSPTGKVVPFTAERNRLGTG